MSLSRALRKSVGRLLIGAVLFAQLALAAYACPGLNVAGPMAGGSVATTNLFEEEEVAALPAGCDQLDPDAINLCAEHCHPVDHSAHTAAAPVVSLGILTVLYSLPLEPQHSRGSGRSFPVPDARLDAAPEPPHTILHCVFRI